MKFKRSRKEQNFFGKRAEKLAEFGRKTSTALGRICYKRSRFYQSPVATHLRERLNYKVQIDELESKEVVHPVEEPTEWISNIVIVSNQEKLRIYLDMIKMCNSTPG